MPIEITWKLSWRRRKATIKQLKYIQHKLIQMCKFSISSLRKRQLPFCSTLSNSLYHTNLLISGIHLTPIEVAILNQRSWGGSSDSTFEDSWATFKNMMLYAHQWDDVYSSSTRREENDQQARLLYRYII